jgi:hypothetical protein
MTSKLEIINAAGIAVGEQPIPYEFDGSDEWTVGHSAFERHLPVLLARHNWNFATKTAALSRTGASTQYGFTDRFARPTDLLHLRSVTDATTGAHVAFAYVDGEIHAVQNSGLVEYVAAPAYEAWPSLFVETLTLYIEAAFLRDRQEWEAAQSRESRAEAMLNMAANRTDQELGARVLYRSRLREARSIRRG